jgi:hypothetical protein
MHRHAGSILLVLLVAAGCDRLLDRNEPAPSTAAPSTTTTPAAAPGAAATPGGTPAWDPSSGTPPPKAAPPQGTWLAFESAAGKFKAEFPKAPTTESAPLAVQGMNLEMTTYSVEDSGIYYAVATVDYPSNLTPVPAKVLDGARDGAVANIQGKLAKETQIEVDGSPGRRITIEAAAGGIEMVVDSVLVLVGHRLYQAIVVRPKPPTADENVTRFLGSLHPAK